MKVGVTFCYQMYARPEFQMQRTSFFNKIDFFNRSLWFFFFFQSFLLSLSLNVFLLFTLLHCFVHVHTSKLFERRKWKTATLKKKHSCMLLLHQVLTHTNEYFSMNSRASKYTFFYCRRSFNRNLFISYFSTLL